MFIFATGARLKQLVYVCILPSDWLGDLSPATELGLNRFWLFPFGELVCHLIAQVNNSLLAAYVTVFLPKEL